MRPMNEIEFSCETCDELGAVLTETKQKNISLLIRLITSLGGVVLTGVFLNFVATLFSSPSLWSSALYSLVVIVGFVSILCCVYSVAGRLGGERCLFIHENGIRLLQSGKETIILNSQLHQFRFKKTRLHYEDGPCYGIKFDLEFKSNSTHSIKWSGHNSTVYNTRSYDCDDSTDYDWLSHHLSPIVANNIAKNLEMGHKIPWGNSAFIQKAGLEIKKKTGVFFSEMNFVPWSDLKDIQFRDGRLTLVIGKPQSSQSWSAIMNCDEANILPGYLVVKKLIKSGSARAEISYQSEVEVSSAIAGELKTPHLTV